MTRQEVGVAKSRSRGGDVQIRTGSNKIRGAPVLRMFRTVRQTGQFPRNMYVY